MVIPRDQNVDKVTIYRLVIVPLKEWSIKYFGTTQMNQNYIEEEILRAD